MESFNAFLEPCAIVPVTKLLDDNSELDSDVVELPSWDQWQVLCERYFIAVDPIAHLLSKTAFVRTARHLYESYWQRAPIRDSMKALVLAVCYTASVSMSPSDCQQLFGIEKTMLVHGFKKGTETQLRHSGVLKENHIENAMAAVIYLVCRTLIVSE